MQKLLFLIGAFICLSAVDAHADTCTLISRGGGECLQVEPYTKRNSEGNTEYHWRLHNRCDVEIRVSYFQRGFTLEMGEVVPPNGTANATGGGFVIFDTAKEGYYDFRVKGCSPSKEQGNDKKASDAATASQRPPLAPGQSSQQPPSAGDGDQTCANYKNTCMSGCSQNYQITSDNYHNCTQFCSSPCSNGTLREANPYLKSGSTNSNQGRKFSKDECRDDACANADFGVTGMGWRQKDAASAICDQQYLQCLKDGQAKPNPQEAVRIARSQVPDDPPTQPAPAPAPSRPAYASQTYGPLADCFWDPIFLSKGGVAMCLGPSSMRAQQPGCFTPDIVNGRQAYICQGANQGPEMFYSRKSQYGGGRSW